MYTILHIEQSHFIKKIVQTTLLENGFNCISVCTAKEAFNVLLDSNKRVDLIITSLLIPDDTIENFMANIHTITKGHIPIFVVSGNDIEETKKRILNLGISDYITKDCLPQELLKHVEFILEEDKAIQNLRKASIAIVDDNKFDLGLVKDILSEYAITNIDFYSSGKSLMESNKKYDLYLIDIVLEKEFGKNIIVKIRKNNTDSSIIVLTSLTNNKVLSSMLNAGADDYITKPIDSDIFIAKLKSNMRTYSLIKKININNI